MSKGKLIEIVQKVPNCPPWAYNSTKTTQKYVFTFLYSEVINLFLT